MKEETIDSNWKKLCEEFNLSEELPTTIEQFKMMFYIGANTGAYLAANACENNSQKQKESIVKELQNFLRVPTKH